MPPSKTKFAALPSAPISLKSTQIGRCGELLVQYNLLRQGIESAALTTDAGVDLVAYAPKTRRPLTIQVKTNLKPKAGGGKGSMAVDWWVPEHSPAELITLVDLSEQRVWVFLLQELASLAQQKSARGYHLYMYSDPDHKLRRPGKLLHISEFESFLLPNRIERVFEN